MISIARFQWYLSVLLVFPFFNFSRFELYLSQKSPTNGKANSMCSLYMVTRTKSTYPNTRKNVAGAVKFFSIGEYYCYNYKIPLCIDVFFCCHFDVCFAMQKSIISIIIITYRRLKTYT